MNQIDLRMSTERQKEIVDAALELISKNGIQGFTIKNLAKKIGITEPAIYRHFDNKIHILITILEFFKNNAEQIFSSELNNNNKAIDKINHLFTKYFVSFFAKPSLVSVIFSEEIFKSEPMLSDKIAELIARNDKILTQIITSGQQNGELRTDIEAKHLSIVVMGTLRLFVKKWQFSNYSFNLPEEGKKLFNTIKLLIQK
jgi:AcrR family transcriptional regulator